MKLFILSHSPVGSPEKDFNKSICAVVPKKKDAKEYIKKKYIIDHFDHYESWCALRSLDDEALESEDTYFDETADDSLFDEYSVATAYYDKRRLAAALRVSACMLPVGASYEEPFELELSEKLFNILAKTTDSEGTASGKINEAWISWLLLTSLN